MTARATLVQEPSKNEAPRELIAHVIKVAEMAIEPDNPGFVAGFSGGAAIDRLYRETYADMHPRFIENRASFETSSR